MSTERTSDDTEQGASARTAEEHLAELERRGALIRSKRRWRPPPPAEPIPGALERFLADRGRSWEPYEPDDESSEVDQTSLTS